MPAKGTKKVKAHKRRKYLVHDKFSGVKIEDPFSKPTKVKEHYRKKPKKRRSSKKSSDFDFW
jgi:hypothetical protein